ncbi:MAG: hypothetical protein OEZ14_13375 [Acidimicrobiia bacterium]|nr:hypothetical protein [Acidimicrobiia bacterium]MDH5521510.1 hypothetical protein [Acidimicrobiia bacterium]
MESLLAIDQPSMTDLSAPPLLLIPPPMPAPPLWTASAERRSNRPGIGVTPWIVGVLSLVVCWPLGIPALITAAMARVAGIQSAAAVRVDDLHEAARLLGRSRRYRFISLCCSAVGLTIVGALVVVVGLVGVGG